MAISTYSTGTLAIAANATSVVGTGSNWSGQNAMSGDLLAVNGFGPVLISDVTDATHLTIDAWPYAAVSAGTTYSIKQTSALRVAGAQSALAVDQLVSALNTNGFYVFVGPDATVPDPSLGDDNQYALKATTGQIWQKEGGVWTFVGTFKGFGTPAAWDSATAYVAFDVASFEGTSYVCIEANTNETPSSGDSPPNAFWTVLAAQGEAATVTVGTVTTGAGGSDAAVTNSGTSGAAVLDFIVPAGEGYGGTSTTSLAIGTGSKAFTTQSGLAYTAGARVRASSAANTTNWMEGLATYSGTTLTVTVTKTNGSGTHADWNLNVAGEPGAGDLTSTNNLSDVADAATALVNLSAFGKISVQKFTSSGTYTPSSNVLFCTIECIGGGGGGGGAAGISGQGYGGSGGGSGGYSRKLATAADIGASQTVTIGDGGSAGLSSSATAGSGGDTSVGSLCIAGGGSGGLLGFSSRGANGGAGGLAGTGDLAAAGAPGGNGTYSQTTSVLAAGGEGGSSFWGGGAAGTSASGAGVVAGKAASNYGSGGGGALAHNTASTANGGAGSSGIVIITEYCS